MSAQRFTKYDLHKLAPKLGFEMEGECPLPTKRRPRNNEESRSQQSVIKWWQMACRGFGVPEILLFAIPNGGGRSGPVVGSILKREGLRTGAPDLMLAVARAPWHSLFVEMKREGGYLSPQQEAMLGLLVDQGFRCVVAYSANQAISEISQYLTNPSAAV